MYQWGAWARRPNFWEDLRVPSFCRLLGVDSGGREPIIQLDPQSSAIHRAYQRLTCQVTKGVLYAYYVAGVSWDDRQQAFRNAGISRRTFYDALKTGSVAVFSRAGVGRQNAC